DHIGFAHGRGLLRDASGASHCTNIGRLHRRMIHPLFERWFDIKVTEKDEYSAPRKREELVCLTDKARQELKPKGLTELGGERIEKARKRLAGKAAAERRQILREEWGKLLGPISPVKAPVVKSQAKGELKSDRPYVERVVLEVEPG